MDEKLIHALEIVSIGRGKEPARTYPGCGGIWLGRNNEFPDAQFTDWGLAVAIAEILNAIADGRLVMLTPRQARAYRSRAQGEFSAQPHEESPTA